MECPKRGDGQDWEGSHLLELLPKCDILLAARDCPRRAKGLPQEALADACGLHRTYVGSVERGERNVTLSTLEVFAAALRVSVIDLLTKGTNESRQSR